MLKSACRLFLFFLLPSLLVSTTILAADHPSPDFEVLELKATLAEGPGDIDTWIHLGDLQRFMGYRHRVCNHFKLNVIQFDQKRGNRFINRHQGNAGNGGNR